MARGRFITNEITKDKRINDLSDDTSRLAFTWLITFADAEGRTNGDPALVRSMLFPRRTDVTVDQMKSYIQEWADIGLIEWYEAAGDLWIAFPSFEKNQTGLRKDREPESNIPPPPGLQVSVNMPEVVRKDAGVDPEKNGLIKVKLIKANNTADAVSPAIQEKEKLPKYPERDKVIKHFLIKTGLPAPKTDKAHIKDTQKRWWTPASDLLEWVDNDVGDAVELVDRTLKSMNGLTISSFQSILSNARDEIAKSTRGANPEEPAGGWLK